MRSKPLIQNTFILGRPEIAKFAETIKTTTMVIKTMSAFLDITKVADFP